MRNVSRAALRVAGLMAMALFVAHCGDSDVRVTTGVSPEPGTFRGTTGTGEAITIEVGTIESVTLECSSETLVQHFVPPAPVNSDGTFDVEVTDQGKKLHVSGRFGTNNSVAGTINDEDGDCDTSFDATRSTGVPTATRTTTPTSGLTATPTLTPEPVETATPTGVTATPTGETPTATDLTPTPTPTSAASPCPDKIDFVGTSNGKVLDAGWTGQSHDSQVVSAGMLTVDVTSCQHASKPCGTCNFTGPIANVHADAGDINNQRCTGDTRTKCTGDGDCATAGGTCEFYFGSYLPLSAGGVSTCVGNVVNGTITGTANTETGASAGTANVTSRVYSGPTADNPCPKCVGDGPANDGTRGGTCNSGKNSGQTCDINGVSPNTFFGSTSLDCPPPDLGLIAALPIDLTNTTGTKTKTLAASSPNCRASGYTTLKCFCDTCNNTAATPCASNADCGGGGICGGKRCQGGTKNGTPCVNNSECPGGACGVPGQATAPNQCDDATCTPNSSDTDGSDEGSCEAGPFEQFCGPTATFKSCTANADCAPFAGNTCSIGKNRDCFVDNGAVGGAISASGFADPPSNGESNPTLAALFCVGPTSSSGVNSVAGLPGPGRLELPGHAREIP